MKTAILFNLMLASVSWAAVPSTAVETGARSATQGSRLSVKAEVELITPSADCKKVCSQVRGRLQARRASVSEEYKIWKDRLKVKEDKVMYLRGYSAAEELLKFMGGYYVTRAPEGQMEPTFLVYFMSKCFPESFVDIDHARLSGLVDTVWAAKNLKVAKAFNSCK